MPTQFLAGQRFLSNAALRESRQIFRVFQRGCRTTVDAIVDNLARPRLGFVRFCPSLLCAFKLIVRFTIDFSHVTIASSDSLFLQRRIGKFFTPAHLFSLRAPSFFNRFFPFAEDA